MFQIYKDGQPLCEVKRGHLYFINGNDGQIVESTEHFPISDYKIDENGNLFYERKNEDEIH